MSHQPQQDGRRPYRPAAARAGGRPAGVVIPKLFVISGPSGAGKGTVIKKMLQLTQGIEPTVSATTRPPRPGEADGREYHFLSRRAFRDAEAAGRFLEWVEYGGELYGTLRSEVDDRLAAGLDVILEIELQGARRVRSLRPDAVTIFIAPPSMHELERRLQQRGTETEESIARRLAIAAGEVAAAREFDHVVVNDEVERAAAELREIIERYRSRQQAG